MEVGYEFEKEISPTPTQPGYSAHVVLHGAVLISGNQRDGFKYVDMLPIFNEQQTSTLKREVIETMRREAA